MVKRDIISHLELDAILDRVAGDVEKFDTELERIIGELEGRDLEITDSAAWRRAGAIDSRVSLSNQLRHDIEALETLDREDEARLARRIEFARARLEAAIARSGLVFEEVTQALNSTPARYAHKDHGDCRFPAEICRRWAELHALRLEMVERNLYLVLINVERYSHTTASRIDLIQEGSAALFRAVDGYDWKRGLLFRTYAVHWLNQAFRSYLYNFSNTVRVPVYLQKAMKHINQAIVRLGDRNSSIEEISRESGLAESLVGGALTASRGTHSLDAPMGDEGDGAGLADLLAVEEEDGPYSTELEDVSLEQGLEQALSRLSERERLVVRKRFGIGMEKPHTLAEVAHELGVSLERVRQIQVRAISKMRTPGLRKAVDPFLN